jgi:hypothetical protein
MVDWNKGYSASFYACPIDRRSWRDIGTIDITEGSIKRESTGQRQSADITCVGYHVNVEQWIRIYMDVRQGGSSAHVALFTGLATSPSDDIQGTWTKNTLECYSVLKPLSDVLLQTGWYVGRGRNSGDLLGELLAVSPAPVTIRSGSPNLPAAIVAEDGESNLSMVEKVLDTIDWMMRIKGDGTITVMPKPTAPSAVFDPIDHDCVEPQIKITQDWYSCPNVYMAVSGDSTGIARDDSRSSPLSTISRGREVWKRETGVILAGGESVREYAIRKLSEAQTVQQGASYDRRYHPDVYPGDLVEMRYPAQDLFGLYRVQSQSIEIGHCARTSEQIYKEA